MMSGLKLNFHKCEVVSMGLDIAEGKRVSDLHNCKLGNFPITYMGLPISTKNFIVERVPLCNKVTGRVCPWRGKLCLRVLGLS